MTTEHPTSNLRSWLAEWDGLKYANLMRRGLVMERIIESARAVVATPETEAQPLAHALRNLAPTSESPHPVVGAYCGKCGGPELHSQTCSTVKTGDASE